MKIIKLIKQNHRRKSLNLRGDMNTGDRNTGYMNTGNWNVCDKETGYFNTIQNNTIRVFNKDINIEIWNKCVKPMFIYFELTKWICKKEMDNDEKIKHPTYKITGGYLKEYEYQEAFQKSYSDLTPEEREIQVKLLKALPNFDATVFKEISGIDINDNNKIIILDGKEIKISNESYEAFKKQFE